MFQIYSTQRTQYTMHKSYEFPNPNLDLLFLNSRRSHLYREIHKGYCFPATETLPNNQSSIKSRGYEVLKLLLACRSFLSPSLPLAPPTPTLHRADRHGRHGLTRKGAGHCRRRRQGHAGKMDDGIDCYVVPQITGAGRNIFQGGNPLQESLPLLGLQLVLIVAITRVLYFLLKPFKQPRVVSEIMARPS